MLIPAIRLSCHLREEGAKSQARSYPLFLQGRTDTLEAQSWHFLGANQVCLCWLCRTTRHRGLRVFWFVVLLLFFFFFTSRANCCTWPAPWTRRRENINLKWPMHSHSEPARDQISYSLWKPKHSLTATPSPHFTVWTGVKDYTSVYSLPQ